MAESYPDFDGWTVYEHNPDKNEFCFVKPTDRTERGKFVVWITGGQATPPEVVYWRGRRDCYGEEELFAPDGEKTGWAAKKEAAHAEARRLGAASLVGSEG